VVPQLVGPVSARPLVVHVVNSLAVGGLENGVINLANSAGGGIRHAIVCLIEEGAMRSRLRPEIPVFILGKRPGQDLGAFVRLVALLRRLRPAIVHSRNWAAFDAVPAARLAGVRRVVHGEHGRDIHDPEGRNVKRNWIRRRFAPMVSHYVAVSRDLERWLREDVRVPAGRVSTIPNGVDLSRFAQGGRLEARERLGLAPEAPVICTVGRLDPVKDQVGLVHAFAGLLPAHPQATLVIAGDGPCRDDLARVSAELGVADQVRLLGECRDVPGVLGAADVFALPSIAEGMSNTVLEAMAAGLPVVATRVGGNPELVEDGVTGRLVPIRDPVALREAMAAYLDDPHLRAMHGKASRQRAVECFGLERMCQDYTDLYRRLLAAGPPQER
jgi:sugar transferase (PEP-CTERM/EpsH1 system associated)